MTQLMLAPIAGQSAHVGRAGPSQGACRPLPRGMGTQRDGGNQQCGLTGNRAEHGGMTDDVPARPMAGPPPSAAPSGDRGELRAVADRLLSMMDRLRASEERKRGEQLGSAEFLALAEDAEVLGRLVFRWTGLQLELAREMARRRALGEVERDISINDIQPRPLDVILAAWREAQLRLEIAKPGSPDAAGAADTIERLRDEYHAIASSQVDAAAVLGRHPADRRP